MWEQRDSNLSIYDGMASDQDKCDSIVQVIYHESRFVDLLKTTPRVFGLDVARPPQLKLGRAGGVPSKLAIDRCPEFTLMVRR